MNLDNIVTHNRAVASKNEEVGPCITHKARSNVFPYGLGTSAESFPDPHTVGTSTATAVHHTRSWESSGGI